MPAAPTAAAIALPSTSPIPIELPFGARAYPNGLELPEGLNVEEWMQIGSSIVSVVRSTMFWWGDWLAYGQASYNDDVWRRTLKHGTLELAAQHTGYAVGTLKNAKMVCLRVDRSRRRDGLTFFHLQEIVARVPANQTTMIEMWQERVVRENLTVAALREKLREATAVHSRDPVPGDKTSEHMSKVMEFVRFFRRESPQWHPVFKKRVGSALMEVFDDMRPYLATPVQKA